jgi:3-deoxy-manno-octulosonate cytidylyltransferase (CMP-KDO synthetase)
VTDYSIIIPARFKSTRLPGKPLLDIVGKPMIQRVYEQASLSSASRVIVATDTENIARVVESFGGEVCMTSESHLSGTDRLQEVAEKFGMADNEIVVNVQGDEPLIPPEAIDQVAENLAANPEAGIATLCEPVADADMFNDPNAVKVVCDKNGFAHYFSRAPIPWPRDARLAGDNGLPEEIHARRQIGIYAYRVVLLHQYVSWDPAPAELAESLEQLRAMWNGVKIHVADATVEVPGGVDTQADLDRVIAELKGASS